MKLSDDFESSDGAGIPFDLTHPSGTTSLELNPSDVFGGLLHAEQGITGSLGNWALHVTSIPAPLSSEEHASCLNPDAIEDIFLICHYTVS